MSLIVEVVVDSVESALAAQAGGADRVELCDNLMEGGTTPSAGMIALARERLAIALHVMIRPRSGDFCYSDLEFAVMQRDVQLAQHLGAHGVVFGILQADGTIDVERTRALSELARPLRVTFHRAFDMTRDPFEALETLMALGVERVLSSGQEATALEGLDLLTSLVQRAGERMVVMPGGGIHERNARKIVAQSGAREIHVSGSAPRESAMEYRNQRVFMGRALRAAEYTRSVVDAERIRQLRDAAL